MTAAIKLAQHTYRTAYILSQPTVTRAGSTGLLNTGTIQVQSPRFLMQPGFNRLQFVVPKTTRTHRRQLPRLRSSRPCGRSSAGGTVSPSAGGAHRSPSRRVNRRCLRCANSGRATVLWRRFSMPPYPWASMRMPQFAASHICGKRRRQRYVKKPEVQPRPPPFPPTAVACSVIFCFAASAASLRCCTTVQPPP